MAIYFVLIFPNNFNNIATKEELKIKIKTQIKVKGSWVKS
jgi:hypothetical protein